MGAPAQTQSMRTALSSGPPVSVGLASRPSQIGTRRRYRSRACARYGTEVVVVVIVDVTGVLDPSSAPVGRRNREDDDGQDDPGAE